MEFDGHIGVVARVTPRETMKVRDIRLEIPLRADAATYLMGIGRRATLRPQQYTWRWQGPYDSFWIGDVHAGCTASCAAGPIMVRCSTCIRQRRR